jgi:hypothetical protein
MLSALLMPAAAFAQDSGFLTSYDNLTPSPEMGFARAYIAPGAIDRIAKFNSIMIDQPEIVVAADSKYRGAKPADVMEISETLRAAMVEGLGGRFPVVDEAGEGTAFMNWAVSNIYLKKAKRGVLAYTPVGAVAYGAKKLASDVVDKTRAYEVVFEFEATDSTSGEVLFAGVVDLGEAGDEVQFEGALALAHGIGARIGCRLSNSKLAAGDREDCLAIPLSSDD